MAAGLAFAVYTATPAIAEDIEIYTTANLGSTGTEEKKWYYQYEIGELKIKQSNDGTGIIQDVTCTGCDYQFVKITRDTEVFLDGVKVNLLRARERAGQDVFIEFDKETAEVKRIHL
jgi:hypothetical protein